ncbi:MAG: tyrosine-type recombinase/integrase [Anaerolineae bacterium]
MDDDLQHLINAFITAERAENLSKKTLCWYESRLTDFADWVGERDWRQVQVAREFMDHLLSRETRFEHHPRHREIAGGLSAETVRGYGRTLRRFGNWLSEEGYTTSPPYGRLKLPKAPKAIPRGISMEDFRKMLGAAIGPRDKLVLLLLLDTGCRAGEICHLVVRDVFVDECYALVRGKGNKDRFVFFSPVTQAALREWINVRPDQAGEYLLCVARDEKGGGKAIEPMEIASLHVMLKRVGKRAGATGPHNAHSFRHAFVREQLQNGNNLASVSAMAGHSDVATTNRYAVFLKMELQRSHDRYSPIAQMKLPGNMVVE